MQVGVLLLWLVTLTGGEPLENAAIRAYRSGQLERAAEILETMRHRVKGKRVSWARWNLARMRVGYLAGRVALQRNRPKEAVEWLRELAGQPSPFRDYIHFYLAEARLRAGVPQEAIKLYNYILKEFGRHWRRPVRQKLAEAFAAAGKWEELGEHMKKLLWHPTPYGGRAKVLWQMVEAYVKAGKVKPMKKWLHEFPLKYPLSKEADETRKLTRKLAKQKLLVLKPWTESEKLTRYFNMSWTHPKRALEVLNVWRSRLAAPKTKERYLAAQIDLIMARAHLRLRQYLQMIPLTKPVTHSSYPVHLRRRAIYLLGLAYIEQGLFADGWKFLHKYSEREPELRLARWASSWSARLAMLAQDYKRARRFFWEYMHVYPDLSAKKRMQVHWFRAWCLFRMGEYKKAVDAFRHLARTTRSYNLKRRIQFWTGRAYERLGKWSKARDEYAKLVRYVPLSYYGILAKQRLYLLEVHIRREAEPSACMHRTLYAKPVVPSENKVAKPLSSERALAQNASKPTKTSKAKAKGKAATARASRKKASTKGKSKKRHAKMAKAKKRGHKASKKPKKAKLKAPEPMRLALRNPMWKRKFAPPWQEGWAMMMELDEQAPSMRAQRDDVMRENVINTIQHSTQPVPFPKIPNYCMRRETRYCRWVRRAQTFARLGFTRDAVDELFRGRWVMKRPKQRLVESIRWFRSVSAHHEAIRMTYWLSNWGSSFKENEYFRLRYPPAHAPLLFKFTKQHNVSLAFAWAIMREESLFYRHTYSSAAARGLMQIIPTTAFRIAHLLGIKEFRLRKLYTPQINVNMGCWYLGQLLHKFEYHVLLAAAAYNAGPHRVVAWLKQRKNLAADEFTEEIPFDETRTYVRRVLRSYTVYNYLYRRSLPHPISTVAVQIKNNINF